MKSRLLGAVCVFIYAILSSGQVISATINFSTLDFPGATGTQARGINNAGQVVGFYYDASGEQHGFLKDSSGYTTIDYPGAVTVNLYGINNNGQILGVYSTGDNTIHGFIKSGSSYTTFDHPDTDPSLWSPYGINDAGDVVGYYTNPSELGGHGFLRTATGYETIDPIGSLSTSAIGINNAGMIVGNYASNIYGTRGYMKGENGFQPLSVPGNFDTIATGINNNGLVVGQYRDIIWYGFVWDGVDYTTFNVPEGSQSTVPWGINDYGEIAGFYVDAAGVNHGFIASIVPIPPALYLFASGLIGLVGVARRRAQS